MRYLELACSECDKKCETGHELSEHIKMHTSIQVETEYECLVCNEKYATADELNEHTKVHSSSYAAKAKSPPPSPQRENVLQPPEPRTRRTGISYSQPAHSSQYKETNPRINKRGASASPTYGENVIRERKFYKVSNQDKNRKFY